jgi:hypothetical protein
MRRAVTANPQAAALNDVGGRRLGAAVGFGVGIGLSLAVGLFDSVSGEEPALPTLELPMLLAGTLGGWIIGPRAMRARTRRDWVGAVWRLACLAVLIGDVVVAYQISFHRPPGTPIVALSEQVGATFVLAALGLVFFGWLAIVCTSIAAGIWAGCMRSVRRRFAPAVDQVSGSGTHSPSAAPSATKSG